MQNSRTLDVIDAEDIIMVIETHAHEDHGKPVAIVVLNAYGDVLMGKSMDGVKGPSFWNALRKARTALKFKRSTVAFRFKQSSEDADLWVVDPDGWSDLDIATAMAYDPEFCAWAGGIALCGKHIGTPPIGAIGISNREELEDHALAMKCPERFL